MALRTDEISAAWRSLAGADLDVGWRTIAIAPAGTCLLSAGRRFPGNFEALLIGFSTASVGAAEKLPDGQGFAVERVDPGIDQRVWIALSRKASGSIELFALMARDVAETLDMEAGADEPRLLRVFLGRVRAWQEFMRKGAQPLSPEAEVGLVGELIILSALIDEGVFATPAVRGWKGPSGGLRDFELGTGGVEVKSSLSTLGFPARVGSLKQLADSDRQPLFVAGVRLRQSASGAGLPERVETMRDIVRGDSEAERLLSNRLLAAGYFDSHADKYSRRFDLDAVRLVLVGEGFPRMTPATVPNGVTEARYDIDLDKAPGADVPLGDVLKQLGVLSP